jgi:alpha-glucosidase
MPSQWWRDAVIYQVYVRSFADSNGDGIGDLEGLRSRLDHIEGLGADGIWLNPHYPSPQRDHGYDIADYFDVEPAYGDLAAFDALVAEAHERGLKVLLDVVANHCSSEHPWFKAALASSPGSAERDRFVFCEGTGKNGELPPNNWSSVFGGPAWTRVAEADGRPGQWYLHIFDSSQPDFNWRNADVPALFDSVLKFWFDRGVDGFRIDVAHGMFKHFDLPDWPCRPDGTSDYNLHMWDQPEVHKVYRSWRALADSYAPARELTFVGEVWVPTVEQLAEYLRPDELQQAFYFDLLVQPWKAKPIRTAVQRGLDQMHATGSTLTWTLSNHDIPRTVSRYGRIGIEQMAGSAADPIQITRMRGEVDVDLGQRRARAAVLLMLALPGSVYLYQGEELGLPEVYDLPDSVRQDPIFFRSGGLEIGRDGCRIPLPWDQNSLPSFGFSPAGSTAASWLPQPDWFGKFAVATQHDDSSSCLHLYRSALTSRRLIFSDETDTVKWLTPRRKDVIAFRRGRAICVVVVGPEPYKLPSTWGQLVLSSADVVNRTLPGDSAAWLVDEE